jgi:predicted dehydrogenase
MNPIKLGIIGCGIAARKLHFPALQKVSDKYEVIMVCNHTEPKAKSFAEMLGGVKYVLDYHKLLANQQIEAVLIILPIHLNYRVTLDVLKAGKHVLLEKPIASNLDEARKMQLFKKLYPQVKMVAENFRFRDTYFRAQEIISNNQIGKPYATVWNIFNHITSENEYAKTQWRINHQHPGGFITDAGVHNVAALRMLFGEFTQTNAFSKSVNPGIGKLDTFSLQFKTDQNVHGIFNLFYSSIGYKKNEFLIFGEKGSIIIDSNELIIKDLKGEERRESIQDDGGYKNQLDDFYRAVRENTDNQSPFEESFRDFEILVEALQKV